MARHYNIAYPRMPHVPLSGGGDVKNVPAPAERGSSADTGPRTSATRAWPGVRPSPRASPGQPRPNARAQARQAARDEPRHPGALASEEADERG